MKNMKVLILIIFSLFITMNYAVAEKAFTIEKKTLNHSSDGEEVLQSKTLKLNGDMQYPIGQEPSIYLPDRQHVCDLDYWSYNGEIYFQDQLPHIINIHNDGDKAVAWYTCNYYGMPSNCEGSTEECNAFFTGITALDISKGQAIRGNVIESITPQDALGRCEQGVPCRTEYNQSITSLKAKYRFGSLQFVGWKAHNRNELITQTPLLSLSDVGNSFQRLGLIAIYKTPSGNGSHSKPHDGIDINVEIPFNNIHVFVEEACKISRGCSWCKRGLCLGSEMIFSGTRGFDIRLINQHGKPVSKWYQGESDTKKVRLDGKATSHGSISIEFRPRKGVKAGSYKIRMTTK